MESKLLEADEAELFSIHAAVGGAAMHLIRTEAQDPAALFASDLPVWKRAMDIILSLVCLAAFAPLMAVIAVAVRFTSPGPVLFSQQRAGLHGRPFTCYKFRSMYDGAEDRKRELLAFNERTGPVFKMTGDPRVTPAGRFLRKWSLDELPQLYNVLLGDMCMVGPRPPTLDEVREYCSWQRSRLDVRPGITCLWQVYSRAESSFEEWVRLDLKYIRERSFLLDLKLICLTLPAVLSRKGAC